MTTNACWTRGFFIIGRCPPWHFHLLGEWAFVLFRTFADEGAHRSGSETPEIWTTPHPVGSQLLSSAVPFHTACGRRVVGLYALRPVGKSGEDPDSCSCWATTATISQLMGRNIAVGRRSPDKAQRNAPSRGLH